MYRFISIYIILIVALLAGCASFGAPNMSADQLQAVAGDKSLTVACLTFTGVGGQGNSVIITYDQRAIANGGISVDPRNGCAVNVVNETTRAKPAPITVPPPAPPL